MALWLARLTNHLPVAKKPSRRVLLIWLNASDRLQPRPWMDFRLRQNRRLRPETFHQRAHERPDRCRGHQNRRLALAGRLFEAVTHDGHEFGQLGRLHRKAALLALADQRFGKGLLPFRRQRDQRQVAID